MYRKETYYRNKLKIRTLNVLVFCMVLGNIYAQNNSDWEVAKEKEGVTISYRWLTSPKNIKVREMRAEFDISAEVPGIVRQFNDPLRYKEWQPAIKVCDIDKDSENQWNTYVKFDLPWPFKSKDLVTRTNFSKSGSHSTLKIVSTPAAKAEFKNVNRIKDLTAEWKFIPMGKENTKVIYTTITYDKPEFPRMLVDPILQNKLIESIGLLKALVTQ